MEIFIFLYKYKIFLLSVEREFIFTKTTWKKIVLRYLKLILIFVDIIVIILSHWYTLESLIHMFSCLITNPDPNPSPPDPRTLIPDPN